MILILICPKCKNKMKCQVKSMLLAGKRKVCVYCGHSFMAKDHIA